MFRRHSWACLSMAIVACLTLTTLGDETSGLIAHWRLDETTGQGVVDSVGDHDGVAGGTELGVSGLVHVCARFRGKEDDSWILRNMGDVDPRILAGHTTSPTTVDWDRNGVPDLVVGAEDGFLYYMRNPNAP